MRIPRIVPSHYITTNDWRHGVVEDLRPVCIRVKGVGPVTVPDRRMVERIGPWPSSIDITEASEEAGC